MRTGQLADLNQLRALEAGFPGDRLSLRQLRHHLRSRHAWLGVAADGTGVLGYALLLFRAGSTAARLYSIVLAPAEARIPSMPTAAIARDGIDFVLNLDQIGPRVVELVEKG